MIWQNLLGTFCAYFIYLSLMLFVAVKKKIGFKKSFYSSLRLLLIFVIIYILIDSNLARIAPDIFFALALSSPIFVFLSDMIVVPLIGFSLADLLGSFVFWESKVKRKADAQKIDADRKTKHKHI